MKGFTVMTSSELDSSTAFVGFKNFDDNDSSPLIAFEDASSQSLISLGQLTSNFYTTNSVTSSEEKVYTFTVAQSGIYTIIHTNNNVKTTLKGGSLTYSFGTGTKTINLTAGTNYSITVSAESTQGYTLSITGFKAQPSVDLAPVRPNGWASSVVLSTTQETTAVSTNSFKNSDWVYVVFSVGNAGTDDISVQPDVVLYVDDTLIKQYQFPAMPAGSMANNLTTHFNFSCKNLAEGSHTIKLVVDPDNKIAETNETNNTYSSTFYVKSDTPQPTSDNIALGQLTKNYSTNNSVGSTQQDVYTFTVAKSGNYTLSHTNSNVKATLKGGSLTYSFGTGTSTINLTAGTSYSITVSATSTQSYSLSITGFSQATPGSDTLSLSAAGKYWLTGNFGDITGSVTLLNGGKKVGTGTLKNGVLTFNKGKSVLLDNKLETKVSVKIKNGTNTSYTPQLKAECVFDKADSSDNSRNTAKNVGKVSAAGTTIVSNGWVGFNDELDYVSFTIANAANLAWDYTTSDTAKFTIYDSTGKSVISSKVKAGASLTTKTKQLNAGTYYVAVQSTNAKKGGNAAYTIKLNSRSKFYQAGDNSNDSWPKAASLQTAKTEGEKISGWVGYGDATDYTKFKLSKSGKIKLTLDKTTASAYTSKQLKLNCLDENGKKVAMTLDSNGILWSNKSVSAGTYYLNATCSNVKKFDTSYNVTIGTTASGATGSTTGTTTGNSSENYVVMFACNSSLSDNYTWFIENFSDIYSSLRNQYNIPADHIYVLNADGRNSAVDMIDPLTGKKYNTNMDAYCPGANIYSATKTNFQSVISTVSSLADSNDHVLVYTFGHGHDGGGANAASHGLEYIEGWDQKAIYASEFADMVAQINAGYQTYLFAQCYSGGILDALNMNRSGMKIYGAAAANHYTEAIVAENGVVSGFHVQVAKAFKNSVSTTDGMTTILKQNPHRNSDGSFEKGSNFQIFSTGTYTAGSGNADLLGFGFEDAAEYDLTSFADADEMNAQFTDLCFEENSDTEAYCRCVADLGDDRIEKRDSVFAKTSVLAQI